MALKDDISGIRNRMAEFAARFDETMRGSGRASVSQGNLLHSVFLNLRDLLTQGVTREGLRDLVRRDARETIRYYTRLIDFDSLRALPWYQRYPMTAWKVFLALAYRLSPPRRLAFAAACLLGLIGWVMLILFSTRHGSAQEDSGAHWLFLSFVVLLFLLFMELRDKLDLKGDLEVAREIQFGLVPTGPFHQDSTTIHCFMRPANTVGGDYYDIIQLADKKVAIVVGDVAGKGMPAALLMALLQGSLRTLVSAGHRGADLVAKLNDYLCRNIPENKLVTLFYGELDTAGGQLSYVNAGHNAPFLMRADGGIARLPATSLVAGVDSTTPFEAADAEIQAADRLLLFTDGVTEAFNLQEQEYGEARLLAFLQRRAALPPEQMIKNLVADVLTFCGAARQSDDMTLMLVTRDGSPTGVS